MEKNNNFIKILAPYIKDNLWIALSPDRKKVVGKGETVLEALKEAKEKKVKNPSIIKATQNPAIFIGVDNN